MAVLIAVGPADGELLIFKQNESRVHVIRKNGVGMLTAVTENPHHTKVGLFSPTCLEVNDGAAIVVVDVTVTGASADGTGFKVGLKLSHVGIKKRF